MNEPTVHFRNWGATMPTTIKWVAMRAIPMTNPVHCTGIGDAKEKAVDAAALVPIFTSCGYCDRNSDSHYNLVGRKHRGFDLAVEEKKK
jgi:hypothetical protein